MQGSVKQDKDTKKWFVVFDAGMDPVTGKRKQKKKRGFKTKKEAETFLNEQINQIAKGTFIETSQFTVKGYLEYWLENTKSEIAAKTYENYSGVLRYHLIPAFQNIKLADLKPVHAQQYFTDLADNGDLANSTIGAIHRVFKTALNRAVEWELIPKNILVSVKKPRAQKSNMQVLDTEQINKLLDVSEGGRYYAIILAAIYTGMRRGELLGLTWSDVDMEKGAITVRQTAQRITGQGVVFNEPKTPGSRRTISIPQSVVVVLRKEKVKQLEYKLKLGQAYQDNGLVFSSRSGKPIDTQVLQHFLKARLKAAGLPSIRFHDLRHTHATLLLQQGVHPKVVSERLGHSNISMTLDTYSHVLPNMQQEVANKLDEALNRQIK